MAVSFLTGTYTKRVPPKVDLCLAGRIIRGCIVGRTCYRRADCWDWVIVGDQGERTSEEILLMPRVERRTAKNMQLSGFAFVAVAYGRNRSKYRLWPDTGTGEETGKF